MKCFLLACVMFAAFGFQSFAVKAEGGCPPGQYPQAGNGWRACVPVPNPQAADAPAPRARWVNQFQAIVTDTPKGILGAGVDRTTPEEAQQAAFADCRAKGGEQCELETTLRNGCLAMALGENTKVILPGDTKLKAETAAMSQCGKHNKKCEVYYSACSLPVGI